MGSSLIGYSIRLAIVRRVANTYAECEYIDSVSDRPFYCPLPHPFAGRGSGVFVGVERDTMVAVSSATGEDPFIVSVVPDPNLYYDQEGVLNSPFDRANYPNLLGGEVQLRSSAGSYIELSRNGNISIDAGIGNESSDIELSTDSQALFTRTENIYNFTEAGRKIEGVVRRDFNEEETTENTETMDFLTSELYDSMLSDVGRSPENMVQARTTNLAKSYYRNPALVEKREITYEYANSFGVRGLTNEANAIASINKNDINEGISNLQINGSSRENRRTDILDLNLRNYNHLIERTEGTVVDIYGNILDINRNIIRVPRADQIIDRDNIKTEDGLRRAYSYLRRSTKYHLEINSRKEISDLEPSLSSPGHNAKDHSRWSIDVDGEGLTKINIPSSSETGNIPVLSRYVVSRNEEKDKRDEGWFKDEDRRDIRILQFGAKGVDGKTFAGQNIDNSEYVPVTQKIEGKATQTVTIGTAHHDIRNIASSILRNKSGKLGGKLRDPDMSGGSLARSVTDKINNKIPPLEGGTFDPKRNTEANAGGRSVHANLDGSLEMSVGADTADRKSMVLDLAGGMISHIGRDRNGRSVIQQMDGDVIIQVGGKGISDDPRFNSERDTEDRAGRVEIHLNRPGDNAASQKIIIDENGITIDVNGNGLFQASGNLTVKAGGNLLLAGENVFAYGGVDDDIDGNRTQSGSKERYIVRKGRKI